MKFKKILTALIASSILLVGCTNKEESKKEEPKAEQKKEDKYSSTILVREDAATTSEITYYYEGDIVKIQTAKNVIKYAPLGKTKDEIKTLLDPPSKNYQNIKGVNQHIDYGETEAIEELSVDYDEVDVKELRKVQGTKFTGDENDSKISYSKSIELLKNAGFVIKQENKK